MARDKRIIITREQGWQVAHDIRSFIAEGRTENLREFLDQFHAVDIALALQMLDDREKETVFRLLDIDDKADVLDEVDAETEEHLVRTTDAETLSDILEEMPPDEGADLVQAMDAKQAEKVLRLMDKEEAEDLQAIMQYPPDSAGGIMTVDFVAVQEDMTAAQAIEVIRQTAHEDSYSYVYTVDDKGTLKGVLDLRKLILASPDTPIRDIETHGVVFVFADQDQEQVAERVARYDLLSVPVVDRNYKLLGIVTAHDVIDVIHEEHEEDVAAMVGSGAEELDQLPARRRAVLRLPWLMITIGIQLIGGLVIAHFHYTLTQVILLASFMPVIQAISGNTGLQSAAIIVRGLATGHVQLHQWRHALWRQLQTTLLLGIICGTVVAVVGGLWHGKWTFGLVVGLSMFISINLSAVAGTCFPMLSKRIGFDPALTAGPF
ncbi:MAG: magnesium transporter, partial [Abditibacteriales bacterium]|nr:magnesium transporter [Abditibacteriales bacterium]MDW8364871.1 magnesium transporter [Abditibacteriales bacterium]